MRCTLWAAVLLLWCVPLPGAVRLGSHSKPSRGVTVLPGTFPNPVTFYNHFVAKGEPLLMKGVLPDTEHMAYKKWTDKYLRSKFGDEFVHVENGKKENRDGDIRAINFAKYLDIYQDIDLYMVYSAPPSMQEELQVPFTLQCGGFQKNLHDAVIWFSSGDTKSVLHYDGADNILCSLDGTKQVVLIDKKYADTVMAHGFEEEGGYSLMDVDNVDEKEYSGILSLPWIQTNITKGDCLYIPYRWFHQVYSPPGRNLAVNMWFSHLLWFNKSDCDGIARGTPFKSLAQMELASPNEQLRTEFLEAYENMEFVKKDEFIEALRCEDRQDRVKIWNFINEDGDEELTWPEMYSFNMDSLVAAFPQCFMRPAEMEDVELEEDNLDTLAKNVRITDTTPDTAQDSVETTQENIDATQDSVDTTQDSAETTQAGEDTTQENMKTTQDDGGATEETSDEKDGFEGGEKLDEEELDEINTIFQKVYKDTVDVESQIVIEGLDEPIQTDYEADKPAWDDDKVSDDKVSEELEAEENVADVKQHDKPGNTAQTDIHEEL